MFVCYQVLQDMVPPKKHLLRHQPANAQIGLMEGNTFCTTLQPRLFTMDLSVVEHKVFYTEVSSVQSRSVACHTPNHRLRKFPVLCKIILLKVYPPCVSVD